MAPPFHSAALSQSTTASVNADGYALFDLVELPGTGQQPEVRSRRWILLRSWRYMATSLAVFPLPNHRPESDDGDLGEHWSEKRVEHP